MKKFIPVLFTLMLAPTLSWADDFTSQAVDFCRSKGGSYTMGSMMEEGDKYCRQVTCKKTNTDRFEIPEGAPGPEANVEATKKVCVAKKDIDGQFDTAGAGGGAASTAGAAGGASSGASGGAAGGSASSGGNLSTAGASGGAGAGSDDIYCEELEGSGSISRGMPCYNECKSKRDWKTLWTQKKEGLERKSCVSCLLRHPDLYKVKKEYLPKDSNGKIIGDTSVSLGAGVTVRTGQIVCKDGSGNIVRLDTARCPAGSSVYTGSTGGAGTGGSIIIGSATTGASQGGAGVGVGGGISIGGSLQLPEFCRSTKKADKQACEAWIRVNGRYACANSSNPASCMGDDYYEMRSRYETDCVNCAAGTRQQSTLSGIAEIVGAIAPPLAHFGSAYVGAKAYEKSNKAWAGAAAAGFEQCRLSQQDYMTYLQTNELPGLTPTQKAGMNCNGYNLGQFAGMGGIGGMQGWGGSGYSTGFLGGLLGPYGGQNPYGNMYGGMLVGSIAGGLASGMSGGYGYTSGMSGGMGMMGGVGIAGGYAGGYNAGVMGGYAGGYAGGMMGGYAGGYNAGMMGGYQGGGVGGINLVGSIAGGLTSGMSGGYGYTSGMAGGMVGGIGGAYPGGYPGAYPGWGSGIGNGVGIGGQFNGGYWGGTTGSFNASNQASNIDRMLQQQGASYQMGMTAAGTGYNQYGSAGYHPMNAGASFGAQVYW